MSIFGWLILGLIAGFLASHLFEHHGLGVIGDTFVGVIGAIIGGFVGSLLFGWDISGFNLSSIILATLGAIVLLAIVKAFTPRRTYPPV